MKIWFNTTKERKSAADNGADCRFHMAKNGVQTLCFRISYKNRKMIKKLFLCCPEIEFSKPK